MSMDITDIDVSLFSIVASVSVVWVPPPSPHIRPNGASEAPSPRSPHITAVSSALLRHAAPRVPGPPWPGTRPVVTSSPDTRQSRQRCAMVSTWGENIRCSVNVTARDNTEGKYTLTRPINFYGVANTRRVYYWQTLMRYERSFQ